MPSQSKPSDEQWWESIYHKRVDPIFLPISVRQNRIEDIFFDFLVELSIRANGRSTGKESSADRFTILQHAIRTDTQKFELPAEEAKRELVFRWLKSELVRPERATNRRDSSRASYSLVPLHLVVAERFGRPPKMPAYGAFLCDMLSIGRTSGDESAILRKIAHLLGRSDGDPLATILELALGSSDATNVPTTPWQTHPFRYVLCVDHATRFQQDVGSVLRFRGVSRRTMLVWLYSLFALYLSTYFLRMARGAEALAKALADVIAGKGSRFQICPCCRLTNSRNDGPGQCANGVEIVLGDRNLDHARLLKRYPFFTSQLHVARSYLTLYLEDHEFDVVDTGDKLARFVARLTDESRSNRKQVFDWFALLASDYPTVTDNQRRRSGAESSKWRLTEAEKSDALGLMAAGTADSFETLTLYLNFADMACASNNVMEWQFYQTLARDPAYGFARGRGEDLQYALLDGVLSALVHAHVAAAGGSATLASFERSLQERGIRIDDAYRSRLVKSLVNLGLLEDVADAGDAKRLTVLYELED